MLIIYMKNAAFRLHLVSQYLLQAQRAIRSRSPAKEYLPDGITWDLDTENTRRPLRASAASVTMRTLPNFSSWISFEWPPQDSLLTLRRNLMDLLFIFFIFYQPFYYYYFLSTHHLATAGSDAGIPLATSLTARFFLSALAFFSARCLASTSFWSNPALTSFLM